MAFPEFQTKEVLNKVLNSGKDALNVDLADSVTVTVDSEFPAAAALQDDSSNPTTTSVGSHLLGYDSGNTNWNRVEVDDAGHLQIDVLSITAGDNNIGNVDIASIAAGDNNIGNVDIASALPAGSNTIGVVDLGSTDNAVLDAIAASLSVLDDWDDTNYANVNMNFAGSDAQAGEGAISATTQRVTIATDDDGVAHLATIAGAVSTQMQVDVVASLPAGDNNIGNVDIVSLPASTNTIEVVGDAAENANASGNPVLIGGRYDASGTNDGGLRTLGTTDVGALALDPKGVLLTKDFTGQAGSILVTGTGAVAAGYGKFIAIQFIEDTVFNSSANGLSASDVNRWPDETGAGSDISSNGAAIDGVTFPQGMTIFGRWDDFTLASGKVIAYIGYV